MSVLHMVGPHAVPLVSHGEYADGQTDRRRTPDRYITLSAMNAAGVKNMDGFSCSLGNTLWKTEE